MRGHFNLAEKARTHSCEGLWILPDSDQVRLGSSRILVASALLWRSHHGHRPAAESALEIDASQSEVIRAGHPGRYSGMKSF
jgi:hypothetical protein